MVEDKASKRPSLQATRELTLRCLEKGLVLGNSPEARKPIIRILPGFGLTRQQADQALSIMEQSLAETTRELGGQAQPVPVSLPAR